jgi:hypothetical protein
MNCGGGGGDVDAWNEDMLKFLFLKWKNCLDSQKERMFTQVYQDFGLALPPYLTKRAGATWIFLFRFIWCYAVVSLAQLSS